MFYVWILVISINAGSSSAQMTVVDNISTQAECERVMALLPNKSWPSSSRCIQVQKVKS